MNRAELMARLTSLAEDDYRRFAASLLPGVDNLLGVRLPRLRRLARDIARSDGIDAMGRLFTDGTFEEVMLEGMVIGCLDIDIRERLRLTADFVPKIDNWSVCDSFCAGLRFEESEARAVFDFLPPYLGHGREFFVRFGAVMLLDHFIDDAHFNAVLERLVAVRHEAYYAQMAVAWALSACFVHDPARTTELLLGDRLDRETRDKAIRKIVESRRVTASQKRAIRALASRGA